MKNKQKVEFTFGEFIAAAYQVWGESRAGQMVQVAINARQLLFRSQPGRMIAHSKGRSVRVV